MTACETSTNAVSLSYRQYIKKTLVTLHLAVSVSGRGTIPLRIRPTKTSKRCHTVASVTQRLLLDKQKKYI